MTSAFGFSVPYLETERLILREYRRGDFDLFADHLAHPESSAHLGSAARQTGQLVGNVGAFFREQSTVMEIGWNTYRAFWGKGIASEAAAAVLDYAFDVRREPKVQALIASGNESSRRVAERLGMAYEMETELNGKAIGSYMRRRG